MTGLVVLDACAGLLLKPLEPAVGDPVLGGVPDGIG